MWLRSDNAAGTDQRILAALRDCNHDVAAPYGEDYLSARLDVRFSQVFERQVKVFAAPSGTAANALALASIAGPFDLVACHDNAHPFTSECGAPRSFPAVRAFCWNFRHIQR